MSNQGYRNLLYPWIFDGHKWSHVRKCKYKYIDFSKHYLNLNIIPKNVVLSIESEILDDPDKKNILIVVNNKKDQENIIPKNVILSFKSESVDILVKIKNNDIERDDSKIYFTTKYIPGYTVIIAYIQDKLNENGEYISSIVHVRRRDENTHSYI